MTRMHLLSIFFISLFFFNATILSASCNVQYSSSQFTIADSTKLEGEIYSVVAEAPLFPGCKEEIKTVRTECATTKMLKYIYGNIKYPEDARENGVQGVSVIGFVVAKDGTLHNFEIVRSIGSGCDEEALRVVKSMPSWDPGMQEGTPVNVHYNLPVKFLLEDSPTKENRKDQRNSRREKN